MPWSGRAWNGAAVVAAYSHQSLASADAWLRALTAPRPFPARESLLALFHRVAERSSGSAGAPTSIRLGC